MDVREKAGRGMYMPSGDDYPPQVPRPALLDKPAGGLTADELARLPGVKAEYERGKQRREEAVQKYRDETARLSAQFVSDLFAEYGMTQGHPFAEAAYELAWQQGHSAGHGEVANYFDDLARLWKIAVENGMTVTNKRFA